MSRSDAPHDLATHAGFHTTHWSAIMIARNGGGGGGAAEALEALCRNYWQPIYAFVRRQGHAPAEAQDFTQEFFAHLLQRDFLKGVDPNLGRFRSYLLARLKNFLANEWTKAGRQKRGGGQSIVSFDAFDAEVRCHLEPADGTDSERVFDRHWAQAILDRVLDQLEGEHDAGGNTGRFEALKCFLIDPSAVSYAETAARLHMSEGAVKSAIHRLRARFRDLVREEIAQTVAAPSEIQEEIRYLFGVLHG